jgi:hemoglobin
MNQNDKSFKTESITVYERVGGEVFFVELVNRFYEFVETDPVLRPLYPHDLKPGKWHLASFLAQYWGGPPQYSAERGHPRLRQRHMPFPIGQAERDAWATHMLSALSSMNAPFHEAALMAEYFERTATLMMNH